MANRISAIAQTALSAMSQKVMPSMFRPMKTAAEVEVVVVEDANAQIGFACSLAVANRISAIEQIVSSVMSQKAMPSMFRPVSEPIFVQIKSS